MKLSIITINFNNLEGLKKTYESVVCQTWTDYEWIIIDGGSTDGSREFIEEHQDKFAYWCSEPDKGVYNAMNKGIAKAKGEYLNFMNSGDCFYEKDTLEKVFLQEHQAEILYGDCLQIYEDYTRVYIFPHDIGLYDLYRCNICQQSMFVRSSLLKQEGFDESYRLLADWARWISAALNGATFKHLEQIICQYDMGGMSSTDDEKVKEDYNCILRIYPETIKKTLLELDMYENNIQVQHFKSLMEYNCISNYFMRGFLKILYILFINKKKAITNFSIWNNRKS